MLHNIPRVRKSVVPKHLTPKLGKRNRIFFVNLLKSEGGSLIAIPSQYDVPSAVRLSEDFALSWMSFYSTASGQRSSLYYRKSKHFGVPIS